MKNYTVLKTTSMKLDDKTGMTVSLVYNAVKGKPKESEYRYEGKVFDIEDEKKKANTFIALAEMSTVLPIKDGNIVIGSGRADETGKWINLKLKKMVDFDTGMKILDGFKRSKNSFNAKAKYDLSGATVDDGSTLELTKESLIALKGKTFSKVCPKTIRAKKTATNV